MVHRGVLRRNGLAPKRARFREDDLHIIRYWRTQSVEEMAQALSRSVPSIASRRRRLLRKGLVRLEERAASRPWIPKELELLFSQRGVISLADMAKKLNRTYPAVRAKVWALGLDGTGHGYSLLMLARCLNKSRNFLRRAIDQEDLKASRSLIKGRYGHYPYLITEESVVAFLRQQYERFYPNLIEDRFLANVVREARRKNAPARLKHAYDPGRTIFSEPSRRMS